MSDRVEVTFKITMERSDSIFSDVLAEHETFFDPERMEDPREAEAFLRSAITALSASFLVELNDEARHE
ncbi:hypothetical protein AB0E44_09290 [Micrococcus terreus]|uniref:hypothetical protein n=1 Tax=Micrococcus terreus TaxID=574650 RepID=UPI0033DE1CE3